MKNEAKKMYIAVAGQWADQCAALNWASGIEPFIVARGDDEEEVMARAIERLGHDNVHIHSYLAR